MKFINSIGIMYFWRTERESYFHKILVSFNIAFWVLPYSYKWIFVAASHVNKSYVNWGSTRKCYNNQIYILSGRTVDIEPTFIYYYKLLSELLNQYISKFRWCIGLLDFPIDTIPWMPIKKIHDAHCELPERNTSILTEFFGLQWSHLGNQCSEKLGS